MATGIDETPTVRYQRLIRDLIEDQGLSQKDAAKILDIGQGYLNYILNGSSKDVSSGKIASAVHRLRIAPDYFYDLSLRGDGRYTDYQARIPKEVASEVRRVDGEAADDTEPALNS